MDHASLVRALYRALLHREPSESEVAHWIPPIQAGKYFEVIDAFARCEEAKRNFFHAFGLFMPPGHFYSPIVDVEQLRRISPTCSDVTQPSVASIRIDGSTMRALWHRGRPLLETFDFPAHKHPDFRYYYDNPAFGFGDGIVLYLMLRSFRPRRIIEVGSGFSSACTLDTIDRHLDDDVSVIFIEPFPELLLGLMRDKDRERTTLIGQPIQTVDPGCFRELQENDVLFIDSTHIAKTGSDVCHEFFNILPYLNQGGSHSFPRYFLSLRVPPDLDFPREPLME